MAKNKRTDEILAPLPSTRVSAMDVLQEYVSARARSKVSPVLRAPQNSQSPQNPRSPQNPQNPRTHPIAMAGSLITRDRERWVYLSEGPLLFPERKEPLKDLRPVSLKRKFISFCRYDTLSASQREKSTCPICLVDFRKTSVCAVLRCTHAFHKTCMAPILKVSGSCPLCRRDIVSGLMG
ncbi:hypothetical protein NEDG_01695 [Nematocida displodere]|uniref:RING-type domain-containing protein n=1 Tax=Nematocida displodere TaxID=1805483 RepID=A0A177EG60_9MICR|nr:hypothetical protein NEDG_01695 [Nematocida displodere]